MKTHTYILMYSHACTHARTYARAEAHTREDNIPSYTISYVHCMYCLTTIYVNCLRTILFSMRGYNLDLIFIGDDVTPDLPGPGEQRHESV